MEKIPGARHDWAVLPEKNQGMKIMESEVISLAKAGVSFLEISASTGCPYLIVAALIKSRLTNEEKTARDRIMRAEAKNRFVRTKFEGEKTKKECERTPPKLTADQIKELRRMAISGATPAEMKAIPWIGGRERFLVSQCLTTEEKDIRSKVLSAGHRAAHMARKLGGDQIDLKIYPSLRRSEAQKLAEAMLALKTPEEIAKIFRLRDRNHVVRTCKRLVPECFLAWRYATGGRPQDAGPKKYKDTGKRQPESPTFGRFPSVWAMAQGLAF